MPDRRLRRLRTTLGGDMADVRLPALEAFAAAATRLCTALETPSRTDAWVREVLAGVSLSYSLAHGLAEECEGDDLDDFNLFRVSDEAWKAMYNALCSVLSEHAFYWAYFDPSEPKDSDDEVVVGDLADDLADIYRDLKPGVRAWESDRVRFATNILLQWREPSFSSHWGVHAVSAMRALHPLVYLRGLGDVDE